VTRYCSTFPVGLAEPVEAALQSALKDARVERLLDGLVFYATEAPVERVRELRFVNNSFLVLKYLARVPGGAADSVVDCALNDMNVSHILSESREPGERTFRITVSHEGKTVSGNRKRLRDLEAWITRHTRLTLDPHKPDVEFWILVRSEGCGCFAKRLTRHAAYDKILERGELRPELANILCLLSEPSPRDVFLDPYCGSGAIAIQRKSMPYRAIFASDIDAEKVKRLREEFRAVLKRRDNRFNIRRDDALDLSRYDPGFVTKIVTDPPWGHYEKLGTEPCSYYRTMLQGFLRLLESDGIVVVLLANRTAFEEAAAACSPLLQVTRRFDVLVSGQRAHVFKLRTSAETRPSDPAAEPSSHHA